MSKLIVKKGRTSLLVRIFVQDSSSTTGAGLAGLTSASAGLVCYRARDDDGNAAATQVVLSAGTRGTWSSGGFVEKDATNMPGVYEIGLPDAGQATGSETVTYMLKGATNMAPLALEVQLVAYDPQDSVRAGLTALPNAAANGVGGLPVLDANSLVDVDVKRWLATAVTAATAGIPDVNTKNIGNAAVSTTSAQLGVNVVNYAGVAAAVDANNLPKVDVEDWKGAAAPAMPANFAALGISVTGHISNVDTLTTYTGDTPQTGDSFARLGAPAGASVSADIATKATPAQILTTALTESYAALHAAPTLSQIAFEIRGLLAEKAVAGTTLTVKKLDGLTAAETFTLDSATAPTSITRAT